MIFLTKKIKKGVMYFGNAPIYITRNKKYIMSVMDDTLNSRRNVL